MEERFAPRVSVIIVNYNGEQYLPGVLESLERQTWRSFEVLVVDNASTDGSASLVESTYPWVRLVKASSNLGFAGGNNLGFREARGDYFALLNNDTIVETDWLGALVRTLDESADIGGVASKIVFAQPFLPVDFSLQRRSPGSAQTGPYLISDRSGFEGCSYRKRVCKGGFHGTVERDGESWYRGVADGTMYFPVASLREAGLLELRITGPSSGGELSVGVAGAELGTIRLDATNQLARLSVPQDVVRRHAFDLINNAGSFLEPQGVAGDRGIYEADRGQYSTAEDVTAFCGCSALLSRAALVRTGGFDESLFMYFEDVELSWRIRRSGFRIRYQPESVVRHFHASTSQEWSPFFVFLVARNRILMLAKHAPLRTMAGAYVREAAQLLRTMMQDRSLRSENVRTRLRVQVSLLARLPLALLKRWKLLSDPKVAPRV